jgi:hypothetical protein
VIKTTHTTSSIIEGLRAFLSLARRAGASQSRAPSSVVTDCSLALSNAVTMVFWNETLSAHVQRRTRAVRND